jgi:hypothetical protein
MSFRSIRNWNLYEPRDIAIRLLHGIITTWQRYSCTGKEQGTDSWYSFSCLKVLKEF